MRFFDQLPVVNVYEQKKTGPRFGARFEKILLFYFTNRKAFLQLLQMIQHRDEQFCML